MRAIACLRVSGKAVKWPMAAAREAQGFFSRKEKKEKSCLKQAQKGRNARQTWSIQPVHGTTTVEKM
jgi:hypothetical protein